VVRTLSVGVPRSRDRWFDSSLVHILSTSIDKLLQEFGCLAVYVSPPLWELFIISASIALFAMKMVPGNW
jgi:hypothetical protein